MNFEQIKERTSPLVNKVSPVSEGSLDLVSELILVEVYEKGDVFIDINAIPAVMQSRPTLRRRFPKVYQLIVEISPCYDIASI